MIKEYKFSLFSSPISNTQPCKDITLHDVHEYITGETAKKNTDSLRAIADKKTARQFKARNFDYCTFSGTFTQRTDDGLIQHSGLLCFDFDDLKNTEETKQKLLSDEFFETQLLFVSPSGKGIKWVVEIDIEKAPHRDWFNAISNYLLHTYSLEADSQCVNLSRACFLSHDSNCYINTNTPKKNKKEFKITEWIKMNEKIIVSNHNDLQSNMISNIENLTKVIEEKHIDITPDYQSWRNLGFALSDELGENGREYFHRLSRFYQNYSQDETDIQYTSCINSQGHGITIKTLFHLAKQAGITDFPHFSDFPHGEIEEIEETEPTPTFSQEIKDSLPIFLRYIVNTSNSNEEGDLLFLGTITAISSCLPNVYGIYNSIEVYPNLFLYLTAQASAGKGKLTHCKHIVQPIHDMYRQEYAQEMEDYKLLGCTNIEKPILKTLFIPANSSSSAVYQMLNKNGGTGLIFETEGDTLATTLKSDFGNFSDGLRKAFHHEMISYMRRKDNEYVEIVKPRLSALLSGTPRQILSLIPDAENGLFSRFIFYYMNTKTEWLDVFEKKTEDTLDDFFKKLGDKFFGLHLKLKEFEEPIHFVFTKQQQEEFNSFFEKTQKDYIDIFGLEIVASVRRLGLITFRMAMILTILTYFDKVELKNTMVCNDTIFNCTMTIIKVLLSHTTKVYEMLPSQKSSQMQTGNTQAIFLNNLPNQFSRKDYVKIADSLGIKSKRADKLIYKFISSKKVQRSEHGNYLKNVK